MGAPEEAKREEKLENAGYLKEAPDGGWGWLIVLGGMYTVAMWGGISRCYSVFFGPLMTEFHAEYGTVSWLSGMFSVSYGFATFAGPLAMKRFKRRPMSLVAAFICGFSCFLSSFCHQLWLVQIFMGLIVGLSMGIMNINVFTVTNRYFDKKLHAANQLLCSGISFGPLLICPGYQSLISMYGWRGACQIAAGLFLNLAVASALLRPIKLMSDLETSDVTGSTEIQKRRRSSASLKDKDKQRKRKDLLSVDADIMGSQSLGFYTPTATRRNKKNLENNNTKFPAKEEMDIKDDKLVPESIYLSSGLLASEYDEYEDEKPSFSECLVQIYKKYDLFLFADPLFYLYSLSWIGFSITYFSAFTYIVPYGKQEMGLSDIQASMLISAFAGGEIFSRLMYGLFFDRMPQRFRILYIAILFACFSTAVIIFPFIPGHAGVMVCCALLGALGGGSDGIFSAFITEIFSIRVYPSVFGYSNIFTHSFGMASTVLIGSAVDRFDSLAVPFYIGCATAASSSIAALIMHKAVARRKRQQEKIQDAIA